MTRQKFDSKFKIRPATEKDTSLILSLIRELADYEKLTHEVKATEKNIQKTLFGEHPVAEAIIGEYDDKPVSYALFFYNYSTFICKPGIYLEDLYVRPQHRGKGFGRALMAYIARLARERNCARFEWAVLNWNTPAINVYEKLDAVPMLDWTVYRLSGEALERLANETQFPFRNGPSSEL
jgi:GNAT superfamily N-acetyltransferase